MTQVTAAESFRDTLKKFTETRGRGSRAELTDSLNTHRSAIKDMIMGRSGASQRMQERISA